ncbi:MAG: hypothetical protein AAFX92_02340 [Pseudomonadota bacterium]
MARVSRTLLAAVFMFLMAPTAQAQDVQETVRGCTLIADANERLACFDAAFVPAGEDTAPFTPAIIGRLMVELGDPDFTPDDVDYLIAQNGYLVSELLVGTWATVPWDMALSFYRADAVSRACRASGLVDIAADETDPFRLVATQTQDGAPVHVFDLIWRGGNTFVKVNNMGSWLARIGATLDRRGWSQVGSALSFNAIPWTITPRSADIMVATSPEYLPAEIYIRCPAG